MATTYIVTGRDTGSPSLDYTGTLIGLNIGDMFTTTLEVGLEARLLGAGLIERAPRPVLVTSAGTPDASGKVLTSLASGSNEGAWLPSADGAGGGSPVVRKFPFAFDTPGLEAGVSIYTPTVGDVLLDGFILVSESWDDGSGTSNSGSAYADLGQFTGGELGWFKTFGPGTFPLSSDLRGFPGTEAFEGILAGFGPAANTLSWSSLALLQQSIVGTAPLVSNFPARFISDDPVLLVVSVTGAKSSPGTNLAEGGSATIGAATLYLITATPA